MFLFLISIQAVFAQLDKEDVKFIESFMAENKVPGVSVAFVEDYQISYVQTFGVKSSLSQEKVTPHTLFQAASISKSLTGALFLRNVEKGKISLDKEINTYLQGWELGSTKKAEGKIPTVGQLLSHTGGTNMSGFLGFRKERKRVPTLDQVLIGKYTHPWEPEIKVKNLPNSEYKYSGGGYCVLEKAICQVNQQGFDEQMQIEVFEPCNMESSFFSSGSIPEKESMISIGHRKNGKPIKGNYHVYPQMAAAGLWTTPTDLANFLISLQKSIDQKESNTFLKPEIAQKLLEPMTLREGKTSNYSLGFMLASEGTERKTTAIQHSGANWGYSCIMRASIGTGKAIVVMSNRNSISMLPIARRLYEK